MNRFSFQLPRQYSTITLEFQLTPSAVHWLYEFEHKSKTVDNVIFTKIQLLLDLLQLIFLVRAILRTH